VFYPDYTETQRIGIVPDIEIYPTIDGIREGRDEVLDAALQIAQTHVADNDLSNLLQLPDAYLFQNYPNPFNSSTFISFETKTSKKVSLKIYNVAGQEIKSLITEDRLVGNHGIWWDGCNDRGQKVDSGIYILKFQMDAISFTKKLVLIR
jgi:hypothetical protein